MHCAHASRCGGCSLLHLSYPSQLSAKEEALDGLLRSALPSGSLPRRSSPLFLPVFPPATDPSRFRQKVAFVFAPDARGRGLVMGHYERGSHRVVPVDDCPVHSERGNRVAFALRDYLQKAGIAAAGHDLSGVLRHVIVRTTGDDREAVAMLVVTRNDKRLRAPIRAFLDSPNAPDGFFVNIHDEPGSFMVGEKTLRIAGRPSVKETIGGVSHLISPTAFFQTNVSAATTLQAYVLEQVSSASSVLDLYCGSGLFSLPLALRRVKVTGVEENRQAIEDAETNARLNGVDSRLVRFIASRVEDSVRSQARRSWDAVILDPPRQGCSNEVLEAVFEDMRPKRVVYVSCNPEALAFELPGIVQCGYSIESVRAVDMFPHTDHLEAVVTLTRQ